MTTEVSTHQKAWQYIRELNSGDERLDAVAFADEDRNYTYRQFFRACDRYAEVFSGMGITEAAGSRVGLIATMSVKDVFVFFALNMLGVSVSLIRGEDLLVDKWLIKLIKREGVTDLILPDTITRPDALQKIMGHRKKLGLHNVIVLRTSKQTPKPTEHAKLMYERNLKELRSIKHVKYMKDLLHKYEATPIAYGSGENDEAAAIVHTSGTTKGIHKPVPLSDVALNTAAARMLSDERFVDLRGNAVVGWILNMSASLGMVVQLYCPLAFGCTIRVAHGVMDLYAGIDSFLNVKKWKLNVIFCILGFFDTIKKYPEAKSIDFSSVNTVIFGGSNMSVEEIKSVQKFMRKHGGEPRIINGYGLSECGAANIVAAYDGNIDVDHGIGRPLNGVNVCLRDEETGEFYAIEDGEHTGTLYLSSESNSSGRIGDKVFFETEEIDGKSYVCTHDLVRVGQTGDLFFVGRGNRFFVNNDGMKFDAGVVETAMHNQKGIAECAAVAAYEKVLLHDTVPILYVRVSNKGKKQDDVAVVRRALRNVYLNDKAVSGNQLPWMCVIVKKLPHNDVGKVDNLRIQIDHPDGKEYAVIGVERDGKLVDVRLARSKKSGIGTGVLSFLGASGKTLKNKSEIEAASLKIFGIDYLPEFIKAYGTEALEGMDGGLPQGSAPTSAPNASACWPGMWPLWPMPVPFLPCLFLWR